MTRASAATSRPTWFAASALSVDAGPASAPFQLPPRSGTSSFARLWTGFMSARILIAVAVLALQWSLHTVAHPIPPWLLAMCMAYLGFTVLVRWLARPRGAGQPFDTQWLYTVGVDLAFFLGLQSQPAAVINTTPLLALPILTVGFMGSRALALGTAALTTLVMLGHAVWRASATSFENTAGIAQVGLTGAGLLVLALLTSRLATRVAREEARAQRSRGEARMQALVNQLVIEALPDGVLVVDTAYTVRAANPAALVLLGGHRETTRNHFNLRDHPAWIRLVHLARLSFADGPIEATDVTLHHEYTRGSRMRVRTQRAPSTAAGARGLCVMFLQDQREMEARLRTEKLAAMGRMSAAVAHEIRNPLAAISQANALLAEDLTSPAQQRLATMVEHNAQRLGHIVDDILDVARVRAHEATDTGLVLDAETDAFCREWARQHAVGPRLRVMLGAPDAGVRFAREHLRRILVNLLDNATRHASQRTAAIQVFTHAVRGGPVMLMVWSDSPPLEPSVRRHLFEPFFSSEARSSGLGLFISRQLCERHGATIGHERTVREQAGASLNGNEFFIGFRRAHDPNPSPTGAETISP